MNGAPLLEVRKLRAGYGADDVLRGVDLSLRSGEFVGLLGINGAGKTTLLRALLGLLPVRSGEVLIDGTPAEQLSRREIARRIAWVPQQVAPDLRFRVRDVVAMGRNPYLGPFRPEGPEDHRAIEEALGRTDLTSHRDRLANELSGGERQRLMIARALAQDTTTLLLDEPIANLDLAHQIETLELVRGLCRERTAVAALHDLALAARYCDRLLVLHDGVIAVDDGPDAVINSGVLARYFEVRATVRRDPELGLLIQTHDSLRRGGADRGNGGGAGR